MAACLGHTTRLTGRVRDVSGTRARRRRARLRAAPRTPISAATAAAHLSTGAALGQNAPASTAGPSPTAQKREAGSGVEAEAYPPVASRVFPRNGRVFSARWARRQGVAMREEPSAGSLGVSGRTIHATRIFAHRSPGRTPGSQVFRLPACLTGWRAHSSRGRPLPSSTASVRHSCARVPCAALHGLRHGRPSATRCAPRRLQAWPAASRFHGRCWQSSTRHAGCTQCSVFPRNAETPLGFSSYGAYSSNCRYASFTSSASFSTSFLRPSGLFRRSALLNTVGRASPSFTCDKS